MDFFEKTELTFLYDFLECQFEIMAGYASTDIRARALPRQCYTNKQALAVHIEAR